MTGYAIEITEFTIGYAHIGGVHIAVYLPGDFTMRNLFLSQLISNEHEISQWRMVVEKYALFHAQMPKISSLFIQRL